MKEIKTILIYSAAVISLVTGCKKDKDENPPTAGNTTTGQIIPLKIGNSWNYRQINFISNDTTYYTESIVDDTLINSVKWYLTQYSNTGDKLLVINMGDGLYYYAFGGPKIVYKYPATANESYRDFLGDTVKVESINLSVTVPAGTFSCYKYLSTPFFGNPAYSYLSPNVGLIKQELKDGAGNVDSRLELLSYHLN